MAPICLRPFINSVLKPILRTIPHVTPNRSFERAGPSKPGHTSYVKCS